MILMSTINRRPVKTSNSYDGDVVIHWNCHGIDQNGNRQKWTEITHTSATWVETYDETLFPSHYTYFTTRQIYPRGKFERKQS